MRHLLATFLLSLFAAPLVLATCTTGTSGDCEVGSGKTYSTIGSCLSAMAAGQTCLVFAGAYSEGVTIPAGSAGNINTLQANGKDTVTINGQVTVSSYTSLVGNCPVLQGTVITTASCGFFFSRPSSPTSGCISVASGATQFTIANVQMYACGPFSNTSTTASYGHVTGLTIAYSSSTQAAPNVGDGILNKASHMLYEKVDISHVSDGFAGFFGQYNVIRNSQMHDIVLSDCGSNSSNCHVDFVESEPPGTPTGYNVYEGNRVWNNPGANGHTFLIQTDVCSGNCTTEIFRFNQAVHVGGAGMVDNLGWPYAKIYNNDWVDITSGSSAIVNNIESGSTNNSEFNDIFYFPGTVSNLNAIALDSTTKPTFTGGYNMAFCASGCSGLHSYTYGSGTWAGESTFVPNYTADPQFVTYSSTALGDLHLQSTSPARNAGGPLTTVASGDSGSGTSLVVTDATFFQDGHGITGVQPDCISLTTVSNHVCITAVNYSTNTLTLASAITRSVGDKIWIYSISDGTVVLTGSAPNIGALGTAGSTPPVAMTPSPVAFPNQTVGIQSSPPLTVTVSNTGSATLTLNTPYFTITGINAADFSNTGTGTCTNGGSILAGNSCTVLLVFTPSVELAETATLNISGNANGSATINGTGIPTPPTTLTDIVKP